MLSGIRHELWLTLRGLWRQPGFTAASVATLALGIGASTAIFSVAYGISMRPLPYASPERLVRIYEANPANGQLEQDVSIGTFHAWREGAASIESAALFGKSSVRFLSGRESAPVTLASVSPNFFDVLGMRPLLGDGFKREASVHPLHRGRRGDHFVRGLATAARRPPRRNRPGPGVRRRRRAGRLSHRRGHAGRVLVRPPRGCVASDPARRAAHRPEAPALAIRRHGRPAAPGRPYRPGARRACCHLGHARAGVPEEQWRMVGHGRVAARIGHRRLRTRDLDAARQRRRGAGRHLSQRRRPADRARGRTAPRDGGACRARRRDVAVC